MKLPQKPRKIRLLLIPVAIGLWLIGWSLFWIGSKPEPKTVKRKVERVIVVDIQKRKSL